MSVPHMSSCASLFDLGPKPRYECDCGAANAPPAVSADQLRALARRLQRRSCGPSLDGYELIDGLLAAADLIDGEPGPMVHANLTKATRDRMVSQLPTVPLARLVKP